MSLSSIVAFGITAKRIITTSSLDLQNEVKKHFGVKIITMPYTEVLVVKEPQQITFVFYSLDGTIAETYVHKTEEEYLPYAASGRRA